jgi:ribosome-associated protein
MAKTPVQILDDLYIDPDEIEETFIRAGGPGGQNVNKVSSAVQLRYDARHSPALSNAVFLRLKGLAGRRMTQDGVIVITANQFRSQDRNREDALKRLKEMIAEAATPPKHRRPTRPSKTARAKRVDTKKQRGQTKKGRGRVSKFDE